MADQVAEQIELQLGADAREGARRDEPADAPEKIVGADAGEEEADRPQT